MAFRFSRAFGAALALVLASAFGAVIPAAGAGCPVAGAPTNSIYLPNVTKTLGGPDGWVTPLIVQNKGTAATTIELSFFRFSDGALVVCRSIGPLAPGASYADVPNADADLPDDTQFSVVIRSFGATAVAVVNQQRGSGERAQAASYVGISSGATKVYLPNVAKRFFGYDVPFIVQNVGGATATAVARFTSFDGTGHATVPLTIAPGRSKVIDPETVPDLTDATQYAAVVTSDQPIAVVVNAHNETGAPVAYSYDGIPAGSGGLQALGPYVTKNQPGPGGSSPIVVQNAGDRAAMPTLSFTPIGGQTGYQIAGKTVAPGEAWVFDPRFRANTDEPCDEVATDCIPSGAYTVAAGAVAPGAPPQRVPIVAVVIPTSATTAMAYTAPAIGLFGAPGNPQSAYFPNVTKNLGGPNGWNTPIALAAAGTQKAVLYFYRFSDGSPVTRTVVTFPNDAAGGGLVVDPRDIADLPDGQYAVVANGFGGQVGGTLVGVVLELDGEGDSAMAYEGFPSTELFNPR